MGEHQRVSGLTFIGTLPPLDLPVDAQVRFIFDGEGLVGAVAVHPGFPPREWKRGASEWVEVTP